MKIAPQDRPTVKLQCLRLLLTLRLNPAKSELITLFVDSYLKLTSEEQRRYQQAYDVLPQPEKEASMELVSSWRLEGRAEGRAEGKGELVLNVITRRFGQPSAELRQKLQALTSTQLDDLALALYEHNNTANVQAWIAGAAQNAP